MDSLIIEWETCISSSIVRSYLLSSSPRLPRSFPTCDCLYLSLCLFISALLSLFLSIFLCIHVSFFLSIYFSLYLSLLLSLSLSLTLNLFLSTPFSPCILSCQVREHMQRLHEEKNELLVADWDPHSQPGTTE